MTIPARPVIATLCALVVVGVVAHDSPAMAGAWAQEDKGLYLQLSILSESADRQYKETGETFQLLSEDDQGSFSSLASSLYAEFGLLPSLTVVASTTYRSVELDSHQLHSTASGLGDLRVGTRYQLVAKPVVLSAYLAAKFPTGYTPDPPELSAATLGNGVRAIEGRLLIGRSFASIGAYLSAELGYRLRGSRRDANGGDVDYPPEIPYFAELGVDVTDWLMVRGFINGVHGTGNPIALEGISLSPLAQSYTKVGPSVIVSFWNDYQIQLNYSTTVSGVNALDSQQITVGAAVDTTFDQTGPNP